MHNSTTPNKRQFGFKAWWTNLSSTTKNVIIVGLLAALILCIISFLLIYLHFHVSEECSSPTCARTSMELLLKYVDIKVDPCEDFYQFSCGNFLQNAKLDNRGSWSVQNVMGEEIQSQIKSMLEEPSQTEDPPPFSLAKKYYRACMNETAIEAEGLDRMKQILRQIGGWPTLKGNNWREDAFDWKDAVYKLRHTGIDFAYFFILHVQRDKVDPNKYSLYVEYPYRAPTALTAKMREIYLDFMVDIVVMMGADKQRAIKDQRQVLDFLLKLAEISSEPHVINKTDTFTASQLQYQFPSVPWLKYINTILAPAAYITPDDKIYVSEPRRLRKLLELFRETDKRLMANFMCWEVIEQILIYSPKRMLKRMYEFVKQVDTEEVELSRSKICISTTKMSFSGAVSAAYIQKYVDHDTRTSVLNMIRSIKSQFKETLYKLDWLDKNSADIASETLMSSVEDIPHVEDFSQANGIQKVEISEDKLLVSALNLDYERTNIAYGKLRQPVDRLSFEHPGGATGLTVVYSPTENVLRIPGGRLRGIFYHKNRPQYMNYGALGTVIAHEMYHIITEAKYRGQQGELRSWWSSHSLLNYETKLQCLSNHYGKFIVKMIEHVNASNTRDEDMADLAGLKVAYEAYTNWVNENGVEPRLSGLNFSPKQLFWVSSAIHHCAKYSPHTLQKYIVNYQQSPGQFRVNGALQNLDEFAIDFGCSVGTNMNPAQKCRIW